MPDRAGIGAGSPERAREPNFLIVGVQKAGTTFIAKHLANHPDVFFSRPKELFFFNTPSVTRPDFNAYVADHFGDAGDRRWVGEGSTTYFHQSRAIHHIEQYLGTALPVLVCLRHPVERAFSHYLHDYRRGRRTGGEGLDHETWRGYLSRSLYADRLALWNGRFPRLKALIFDDLVRDGADYYAQAARVLEITPQPIEDTPVNEGIRMVWEDGALTISAPPPRPGQTAPRFPIEEVDGLRARYADDVSRIEDLLARDLSAWRAMPDFGRIERKFGASTAGWPAQTT